MTSTQNRFLAKNGLDGNNKTITNISDPVNNTDASNKQFSSNASNLTTGTLNASLLPTSGVTAGSYGSTTNIPVITVDNTGRVTSISELTKSFKAVLTVDQATTSTTEQVLTNHTLNIPPNTGVHIKGILVATTAATTTGIYYGINVSNPSNANGNVLGSWNAYVNLVATASATGLNDGDIINIAPGASSPIGAGVLGTASGGSTPTIAFIDALVHNLSTNSSATVTLRFRSEVNGSTVTAKAGSSMVGVFV